jgi:PPOX class probable F420-dependent enzyme
VDEIEEVGVNRSEALARVRSARVGRMATVTDAGRPHVVPFVFALIEDDSVVRAYWVVDEKPKRSPELQRLRNLERNPWVEFVVDAYDEDWDRLWWVRCSGTGRVVEAPEERAAALAALSVKYPQYRVAPPPGPVVAIDVQTISGWRATPPSR